MDIKNTVMVFNTCTSQYEEVLVSEEVYNEYRRGEWRIQKNDAKHRANETPFSALVGGKDGAYENFREFVDTVNVPDELVLQSVFLDSLRQVIAGLDPAEQMLIHALFFKGDSEQKYAVKVGVTQQAISKQKRRVIEKLKKQLVSWL